MVGHLGIGKLEFVWDLEFGYWNLIYFDPRWLLPDGMYL